MGQTINVTARTGASPDVRIFALDRSLTGMGIERYDGPHTVHARRPPDVLASRLFELGAQRVTVYSSAIAVQAPVREWERLEPEVEFAIQHLFQYYGDDAGWSPEALASEAPAPTPEPENASAGDADRAPEDSPA